MKPIAVIGVGVSPQDLTEVQRELIRGADIIIGAARHLEPFAGLPAVKKTLEGDLRGLLAFIGNQSADRMIVVLASGDPLFYGIGSYLSTALGAERVTIYPNISSVAAAFARIKEPWHDARVLSLHGRATPDVLIEALQESEKVAVLTDPERHPGLLAQACLAAGMRNWRLCVFEQLGTPAERFGWFSLQETAEKSFAEPNLVVFRRTIPEPQPLQLGLPEHAYEHQDGLITKAEVRAVTLAKLQLKSHHVLWDLGAGSGSVGLEAAIFIRNGRIFAVEKDPRRVGLIERNRARFGVDNLVTVEAVLPDGLKELPAPDRVFVGGGGRNLALILRRVIERLRPDGIVVVNTVVIANLQAAMDILKEAGLHLHTVQVQISRSRTMPWGQRFKAENPVWIVTGERVGRPGLHRPPKPFPRSG